MKELQQLLGHSFSDQKLLQRALTHKSASRQHYEQLEFLGDAVLSAVIAEQLFVNFPDLREGDLSRMRSSLVKGEHLAEIAMRLGLSDAIRMGSGEKRAGGASRPSILADVVEALIGAIYIDADFSTVKTCILTWYHDDLANLVATKSYKDAKTCLQEWTQAQKLELPIYEIIEMTGKAHEQIFRVRCQVPTRDEATEGVARSRRAAEQLAAQNYLDLL